jgi:acyl carrier protein
MSQTDSQEAVERWVISACRELSLPVVNAGDDLFDVGGTSLAVVRLIAKAEAEFGPEVLPPDELAEHSTVAGIAAVIRSSLASAMSTPPA